MHKDRNGSWSIDVRRCEQSLIWALWIRAAERIDVPEDAVVPGPLDIDRLPDSSAGGVADLGRPWLRWWRELLTVRDAFPADVTDAGPPGLPDATGSPELQAVARRRWPEAEAWRRTIVAPEAERDADRDATWQAIDDVTRSIGRRLRPFSLEILTVPVRDDAVRTIGDGRYLVADRLLRTPAWSAHLDRIIREVA